jgi:hypothetical protein
VTRTPALERRLNHVATLLVGISGIAYAAFKWLLPPPQDDPFAVVNHPLQPHALTLHVLAAPLGVLAVGMLLRGHVLPRLQSPAFRRSRRTGILLAATCVPMIASGYLLQVTTSEGLRRAWLVTHLVTGFAWMLGWLAHFVSARRALA